MIALGRALAARGHDVTLQTWANWRGHVEQGGMTFAAAPEYDVFPALGRWLKPYEAVVEAARETRPLVRDLRPDAVIADILTLAPALAGELEGVPYGTLIPHVHPDGAPGFPPYSLGARLPRTPAGRALWRGLSGPVARGLERGRDELNDTRARLGLPPLERFHGGISDQLVLVGTYPQLEYPRAWPEHVHVIGPLLWEPPNRPTETPPGTGPLVLVAPSTTQDPEHRLVRAALRGLAEAPLRVLASWNQPLRAKDLDAPPNARVVDWVSYSATMPLCDLVVCHGGHGTLARALSNGVPVLVAPAGGDMNENAARADWAGVGVRLPRALVSPTTVRLAVRRALGDPGLRARATAISRWHRANDPAAQAAQLVERFAADY
jgi:UDP:flavonoid glycosyltransferase YjiC (YdhE family)